MALVVITIRDEDDTVDIQAEFEPALPTEHMNDTTPAQLVAAYMVEAAADMGESEITGNA